MSQISLEQLASEWRSLQYSVALPVRECVQQLALVHQRGLASHFYEEMLRDAAASVMLSHEQVRMGLHQSMCQWVAEVFSDGGQEQLAQRVARQVKIGEVHARIDVPVHLVLRGASSLKRGLCALLAELLGADLALQLQAASYGMAVIDIAMAIMSQAYSSSHDRSARAQEAYRLHAVAQDMSAERERQRAAVLAWENQLMFDRAMGLEALQLPRIGASEFGLWFRHKGAYTFRGAIETTLILDTMDLIDDSLLPSLDQVIDAHGRLQQWRAMREHSQAIAFHLDALFEQNRELDAGRDVLTRLLNRKFLPVVLRKEIHYSRERKADFAVLSLDVDHFKRINDRHGHEGGDMVLKQLADILSNACRGGDYTFRLGGEEFLLLLVDIDESRALAFAERLRVLVEQEAFRLPDNARMHVTVSMGLAMHSGHPDYEYTLRQSDQALYAAKNAGRNRVEVARV
ncbi:GGDEF domain-containing protein [Acidovorax sp. Be4]|uniref:Diguanylate cyclase DosC n=1 Tax=Acidovorax bellezanensis TaxID=2976702 RepID=A0ABT2PSH6_9BURK|nr:GGDEF domain-containing protein [Acidovorax sp. Be4]MCT9812237.1 GGDEF domain-containing protein [Acidovorax sp. Be4]